MRLVWEEEVSSSLSIGFAYRIPVTQSTRAFDEAYFSIYFAQNTIGSPLGDRGAVLDYGFKVGFVVDQGKVFFSCWPQSLHNDLRDGLLEFTIA